MEVNLTPAVTTPTYLSRELQRATDKIHSLDMRIKGTQFEIAHIMGEVDRNKWYEKDGKANAAEWAMEAFGIGKSLAYALITVGRDYTQLIMNDKGKIIGYASCFASHDDGKMPLIDYTVDKMARLSTLGKDVVTRLHNNGTISPAMGTRELVEIVKGIKALEKAQNNPTENPTDNPTENPTENPTTVEITPVYTDYIRGDGFDNMPSEILIAELNARGFQIYREGVIQLIEWKIPNNDEPIPYTITDKEG